MDPTTLATTATEMLVPVLAAVGSGGANRLGELVTDTALAPVTRLYTAVKNRLSRDSYSETALERAEERPDSAARRQALQAVLAEIIEDDPDFASTLEALVADARTVNVVQDSGAVAGRDVNMQGGYVAGRDITFGR
ncbi:hypothetical protein [Actinomadura harenae]|uniref:Uncharacterized protein n=1 Tax=Actinomadura harenae TaxID=2483351 RepID=A0A3M2LNA8_9ACTN|nr:hypothetical protein [Actinomadura harenae]RMI38951.1 hypothetical protein EBO15_31265 [Actinomadura harenae]